MPDDKEQKTETGLPGIRFIYVVLFLIISGILFLNLQVNVGWLRGFAGSLRNQARELQVVQAKRAAQIMQAEVDEEMKGVSDLAYNLGMVGSSTISQDLLINRYLKEHDHIRQVSLISLEGRDLKTYSRVYSNPDTVKDHANLEYFNRAKSDDLYIGYVNYSDYYEPYVIISGIVEEFGTGKPMIIVKADFYLRGMWEIALETRIGETGRISVIDDKGMLIADPSPARVLRKVNLLHLPPVKKMLTGSIPEGVEYANENSIPVIGVGVPISINQMKWGVLVEQSKAEINKYTNEVFNWVLIIFFGNILIVGILIWLITVLRGANKQLFAHNKKINYEKRKALAEKNKTSAIVSNFIDPVIVIDQNGDLSLFNAAASRIFNFKSGDIGKKVIENEKFSLDVFKKISPAEYQVKTIEKDRKGNPIVEEAVFLAVSGRKQSRKTNPFASNTSDTLDVTYKVMTATVDASEMAYGQMKIFYDMTREKMINEMKSEFISIAAHQLRTPLSSIKWIIKMVLDGDCGAVNQDQKELLAKGYESNERIIRLVNDMLNVSRIEEGRFDYKFEKTDLLDIINEKIFCLSEEIKKKQINFEFKRGKQKIEMKLDQEKISLAIENFLSNAVTYTPENGMIKVLVNDMEDHVEMIIKDNGIGIPKNDQEKLFTKFFRSENVVRVQTEGSGLGLFIARNIIEKHGGSISFASEEGKGTEFIISLPK